MLRLVLATRNPGKIREIVDKLNNYPVIVECLNDYPEIAEIKEDGKTFSDNAIIKAKTVSELVDLPSLADDSGLEIEYLGGKPGILSSRWGTSDQERINKVIKALKNSSTEQRNARFVCVMSLFTKEKKYYITKGICSGKISLSPWGSFGFGYDPIFIPEGYNQTFAQMGNEIKKRISHRAIALKKMIQIIIEHYKLN